MRFIQRTEVIGLRWLRKEGNKGVSMKIKTGPLWCRIR